MDNIIHLTDRTRITTDWLCRRKRYLQYHLGGRGVVSGDLQLELFLGTVLHDSLAAIAVGEADIDFIAPAAQVEVFETLSQLGNIPYANEQAALIEGMLRGFHKHVWPRLMMQYPKIIAIEPEVTFKIDDQIIFMSRPDLIVEDSSGELVYIEYKSTSSKKEEWLSQWNTAVQLHSTVRAVEQTLGRAPQSAVVVGLYKGYYSYGKQGSPFCYGYVRSGQPPFIKDEVAYEYRAGFRRNPVWLQKGGVKSWVDGMPPEILAGQYPITPPIFINDDLVDSFFRQTRMREHEIMLATSILDQTTDEDSRQGILDVSFPQSWAECNPGYGRACECVRICHGRVDDPLMAGFAIREPHHLMEIEQQAQATPALAS